jgi:hypothetical protein
LAVGKKQLATLKPHLAADLLVIVGHSTKLAICKGLFFLLQQIANCNLLFANFP